MTDTPEVERRRLAYRAWRRGTREMDLLLGPYADARLAAMDADGRAAFAALLAEEDTDLAPWLMGAAAPPERHAALVAAIRAHAAAFPRGG
jgi:antitoxin CptB